MAKRKKLKPRKTESASTFAATPKLTADLSTSELIDQDLEVQSFIYQQMAEFEPYVTSETLILVVARDPKPKADDTDDQDSSHLDHAEKRHRIAVMLKDDDAKIEAEHQDDDIYTAIKMAKEKLLTRLIEIQAEIESPQERQEAINQASTNEQIH
jgi:ribosome-associated translation inhibitor RaiA